MLILPQSESPTYRTGRYHDGAARRCVLVRDGLTRAHITYINGRGVVHRSVKRAELRKLAQLTYQGRSYPLARIVRLFRAVGRARGITRAASLELAGAAQATRDPDLTRTCIPAPQGASHPQLN